MKKLAILLFILMIFKLPTTAQLKVTSAEKIPLNKSKQWSSPQFSPDGKSVFFTTLDYQGIWEYSLTQKVQRQITDDPRSGFGFSISSDGKKIAYRRTLNEKNSQGRVQEIVVKEWSTSSTQILASGSNLSTPSFVGTKVIYSEDVTTRNLEAAIGQPMIMGLENTKIAVVEKGTKRLIDPLKNGSYIWPLLSPDAKKIVASDMSNGTFVCDLKGKVLARLGKRNAAVWTRDGRWLIYMNDKDDGHNIISSDLFCISPDGKRMKQLTFTNNEIELYPQCSLVENQIVCSTLDGDIMMLTYEEVKR
ncbi:MAG: hypothetical protein AAB209_07480 [Bacteroidota bacterium]